MLAHGDHACAGRRRRARSPRRRRRRARSGRRSRAPLRPGAAPRSAPRSSSRRDAPRTRAGGAERVGEPRRPDEVVGEDDDGGACLDGLSQGRLRGAGRRRERTRRPTGTPPLTIGTWRNPPTAILLIATATGSPLRRITGSWVMTSPIVRPSSGWPATFRIASRSVKIPTSVAVLGDQQAVDALGAHPLDRLGDGAHRRRSAAAPAPRAHRGAGRAACRGTS